MGLVFLLNFVATYQSKLIQPEMNPENTSIFRENPELSEKNVPSCTSGMDCGVPQTSSGMLQRWNGSFTQ